MRKLSMKNAGTPAIEDDSESGSGGVSADGLRARFPRLSFAGEPPLAAPCSPAAVLDLPRLPRGAEPDGVVPWALCPLTCGVVAAGAGGVAGACSGGDSAGGSVVGAGGVVGVEAPGAGAGTVVVVSGAGVVVSPLAVGWAGSPASEAAGASSASAAIAALA